MKEIRYKDFIKIITESRAKYYHLSKQDVSQSGLSRSHAGSAAAGAEKQRFKYKDGKLDPSSAMIHFYDLNRRPEAVVMQKAEYYNEIDLSRFKILDLESSKAEKYIDKANDMSGDFGYNLMNLVKKDYDAITHRGLVQLYRDLPAKLIIKSVKLTPENRRELNRKGRIE